MSDLKKKPLFNPGGDTDVRLRRMIGGNTTNLNDFNNLRYTWVNNWYRQAMKGISGMCAQPELQLYAGLHLQSGRTKRHSLPVEE